MHYINKIILNSIFNLIIIVIFICLILFICLIFYWDLNDYLNIILSNNVIKSIELLSKFIQIIRIQKLYPI